LGIWLGAWLVSNIVKKYTSVQRLWGVFLSYKDYSLHKVSFKLIYKQGFRISSSVFSYFS
jgi:hypothetical protein